MVHYNPAEYQQLEALIPALNQGMPGSTALSLYGNVNSEAQNRIAQQQAANQQMMAAITGAAQSGAAGGMSSQGLDSLIGSFQSQYPRLDKPKFQGSLDSLSQSLYPQGATQSPLYQAPTGAQAPTVDPNIVTGIQSAATNLASSGTTDLHSFRMNYMTAFRAMGMPQDQQDQMFDFIGQQWVLHGGDPGGAPVTRADAMAPAQAPTQPSYPQTPTGAPDLSSLIGGISSSHITGMG